jgi:hypothetical protein
MGGINSGNRSSDPLVLSKPNRAFTSSVNIMWGVFYKGELESVEVSEDHALEAGKVLARLSGARVVAPVYVLTTDLNSLFLSDARVTLETACADHRRLKNREEADILHATATKSNLAPNHWEPRHKAWLKMEAARRIVEALEAKTVSTSFSSSG